MGRCWTCGASTGGSRYFYTCPACSEVAEMQTLNKTSLKSLDVLKQFAVIQQEGFNQLSSRISDAASIIEWGLSELSWRVEQQTDILKNIEQILNNPNQTKADEWRKIAEELRNRGDLSEAERFFTRALSTNPLDYRIYVGLAETYLKMDEFDKAEVYLQKSLIHAPKSHESGSDFDYRSYSYKLIGHIYMCKENYIEAANALQSSIQLSPHYYDGHYDYAQYCALVGDTQDCLLSLDFAIAGKPILFNLTKSERNFHIGSMDVHNFLIRLYNQTSSNAKGVLFTLEQIFNQCDLAYSQSVNIYHAITKSVEKLNKIQKKETQTIWGVPDSYSKDIDSLKSILTSVRPNISSPDYSKLVDAIQTGEKGVVLGQNIAHALVDYKDKYQRHYDDLSKKIAQRSRHINHTILFWAVLFSVILGLMVWQTIIKLQNQYTLNEYIGPIITMIAVLGFSIGLSILIFYALRKHIP